MDSVLTRELVSYLLTALIFTAAVPVFGYLMGLLINFLYGLCAGLLGRKVTFFIFNRLTFPGVMHHELSHALLAFLTGARIKKISLFKPEGNTLGHVEYVPRGIFLFRGLQNALSSMAPVFCGALSSYGMYYLFRTYRTVMEPWQVVLLFYLLISVILHMTMSSADVKVMWKGLPIVYLLVLLAVRLAGFTLV